MPNIKKLEISRSQSQKSGLKTWLIGQSIISMLIIGGIWSCQGARPILKSPAHINETRIVTKPALTAAVTLTKTDSILKKNKPDKGVVNRRAPLTMRRRKTSPKAGQLSPMAADAAPPLFKTEESTTTPKTALADFSEIAVMNYARQKAKDNDSTASANQAVAANQLSQAKVDRRLKAARPQAGWEAYNKYINNNSLLVAGVRAGTVKVGFLVNAEGSLTNLKIISSVDPETDQAAIKLITSGPPWVGSGDSKPKRITLKIKFRNK